MTEHGLFQNLRPTVITVSAWGARYLQSADQSILRCLLAPGQLEPYGGSTATSVPPPTWLHLGMRQQDAERLICFKPLTRLALIKYADLGRLPPEDALSANRHVLARAERQGFEFARSIGADWFPLCADQVIPNGYVRSVKRLLDMKWANSVCGPGLRARRLPFLADAGGVDHLTAEQLRDLTVKHLHPALMNYFLTDPPGIAPANPHQFFITVEGGFVCHQGQMALHAIKTAAIPPDFVQGDMNDAQIMADLGGVVVADPSVGVALTGLDDESVTTFGEYPATVDEVVKLARMFIRNRRDAEHWNRMVSRRFFYPVPSWAWKLPMNCIDEVEAVEAVRAGINATELLA